MPECDHCGREFERKAGLNSHIGHFHKRPWQEKESLKELYIHNDMSVNEIAERFDCNRHTITKWRKKFDLSKEKPWRDAEKITEKYVNQNKSIHDIADEWGCDAATISNWLDRHGIDIRDDGLERAHKVNRQGPANFYTHKMGYEFVKSGGDAVLHHRLLAMLKFDFEAVANSEVHHKNGVKWDNRLENIELKDKDEHAAIHYDEREINEKGQFC